MCAHTPPCGTTALSLSLWFLVLSLSLCLTFRSETETQRQRHRDTNTGRELCLLRQKERHTKGRQTLRDNVPKNSPPGFSFLNRERQKDTIRRVRVRAHSSVWHHGSLPLPLVSRPLSVFLPHLITRFLALSYTKTL